MKPRLGRSPTCRSSTKCLPIWRLPRRTARIWRSEAIARYRPECGKGLFVEPTVFTGVKNSMRIAQEEVFGPILSVIPFRDEEEAIEIGNDILFGSPPVSGRRT